MSREGRRGPEALFASGGMLAGCQTLPSREVAPLSEQLWGLSQNRYGGGNQRTYPRDRHQSPRHLILFGAPGDLGIELAELCFEMGEGRHQHLERGDGVGRQTALPVFHNGNQLQHNRRALRNDLSELAQMPASRQKACLRHDALMAWLRCRISNSRMRKTIAAPCVSSLFTGTKRIVGRCVLRLPSSPRIDGSLRERLQTLADRLGVSRIIFFAA